MSWLTRAGSKLGRDALDALASLRSAPSSSATKRPRTTPLRVAHKGGCALWPGNSEEALRGSLEKGAAGIELDLSFTRDLVPLISHDPWLQLRKRGIWRRGLLRNLTWAQLEERFDAGEAHLEEQGPDPRAWRRPLLLAEVIDALRESGPGTLLYLDVKLEWHLTVAAAPAARALSRIWARGGLDNPLTLELLSSSSLRSFRQAVFPPATHFALAHPPFFAAHWSPWIATRSLLLEALGRIDPLRRAQRAGADAVTCPAALVSAPQAARLREAGLQLYLFGAEGEDEVRALAPELLLLDDPLGPGEAS